MRVHVGRFTLRCLTTAVFGRHSNMEWEQFQWRNSILYYLPQCVIHIISSEQTHLFLSAFRTSPGHLSSEETQWANPDIITRGEMMALIRPDIQINTKQHKSPLSKVWAILFRKHSKSHLRWEARLIRTKTPTTIGSSVYNNNTYTSNVNTAWCTTHKAESSLTIS